MSESNTYRVGCMLAAVVGRFVRVFKHESHDRIEWDFMCAGRAIVIRFAKDGFWTWEGTPCRVIRLDPDFIMFTAGAWQLWWTRHSLATPNTGGERTACPKGTNDNT